MIFDELNKLLKEFDRKYDINSGGCCFVAFCIAAQLWKRGIPYKLVVLGDQSLNHRELKMNIRNNDGYYPTGSETANHYVIQVGEYYINLGTFNLKYYEVSKASFIKPQEIYEVYRTGYWNQYYERSNNLKIYREIKKFFNRNEEKTKNFTSSQL